MVVDIVVLVDDVPDVPVMDVSVVVIVPEVSVIIVSVDMVPVVIDVSVIIVADVSVTAVSVMLMFSSFLHPKANSPRATTIKSARLFFIFSSLEFFVIARDRCSHIVGAGPHLLAHLTVEPRENKPEAIRRREKQR